ncbi:hypothetical protein [Paenibacillus ehimensis]|uniref:Uncharacterized protein n=1 Tax=Paenibacillus ehimensis TaxID=79264 RepID=A0ABT8V4K1_9BACL|nr:hypothetical protein [Paenibacillus ehimensis]MDO3675678.1 hypothetical protein [Paenibacillus ehimensis]MEC0207416.1 hypothetical protein [Paenibacillus ehimensis]
MRNHPGSTAKSGQSGIIRQNRGTKFLYRPRHRAKQPNNEHQFLYPWKSPPATRHPRTIIQEKSTLHGLANRIQHQRQRKLGIRVTDPKRVAL